MEAGSGFQSAAELKEEPGPPHALRDRLQVLSAARELCMQYSVPAIPQNQQQFKRGFYYLQKLNKFLLRLDPHGICLRLRFLHSLLGCN